MSGKMLALVSGTRLHTCSPLRCDTMLLTIVYIWCLAPVSTACQDQGRHGVSRRYSSCFTRCMCSRDNSASPSPPKALNKSIMCSKMPVRLFLGLKTDGKQMFTEMRWIRRGIGLKPGSPNRRLAQGQQFNLMELQHFGGLSLGISQILFIQMWNWLPALNLSWKFSLCEVPDVWRKCISAGIQTRVLYLKTWRAIRTDEEC